MRQAHSTDENQNFYFGNQKVDASTQTENSVAEQSEGEVEEKCSKVEIVEAYLKSNEWSIWYNIIGSEQKTEYNK